MKRLLLLMLAILSLSVGNAKLYKGDMDYNGIINVADLTKLVSVIMGTTDQYSIPADTIYTDDSIYVAKDGIMGDMDGNSTVNVADLTSLVSVIMGLKEAEDVDREAFPNKEYEYVDLELPSGTLWAKYNIGAERETDYGNYFAWGETVGYNEGKKDFFIESYKWSDGSSSYNAFTKYVTNDVYGTVDSLSTLLPEDDAARVLWGKKWCIPSSEQLKELTRSM